MIVSTNVEDSYNIIVLFLYTTVQQDLTNAPYMKKVYFCVQLVLQLILKSLMLLFFIFASS